MRKVTVVFLSTVLITVILSATLSAQEHPPTIGLLLPLTGAQADWGKAMHQGAQLAVKEAGTSATLVIEDTQFQPAIAISAYDKLRASSQRLDALVVFGSGVSMAISPRAEQSKLLMISIATSDDIQRGRNYIFRHMVATGTVTDALLPFVRARALRRIAAISTTQDGMLAFQKSFISQAKERVRAAIDVPPTERDFATIVQKLLGLKIDSIYSTLLPPQTSILARQARQLGFKGQIFAATQVNSAAEISAGGESFEGLVFAADGESLHSRYDEQYRNEFGALPDNFSANAYDCVKLLMLALKTPDPLKALSELKNYHGALGIYSARPDHSFSIPAHLRVVKNGAIVGFP